MEWDKSYHLPHLRPLFRVWIKRHLPVRPQNCETEVNREDDSIKFRSLIRQPFKTGQHAPKVTSLSQRTQLGNGGEKPPQVGETSPWHFDGTKLTSVSSVCRIFHFKYAPGMSIQGPQLAEVYSCLCDEMRLRIVHLLAQSPLCVCHLQEILGLTQVAASKHLAYLRLRGLVESQRHEQWMIYSLPKEPPRELDWQLRCLQDCLPTYPVFRDDLRKFKALQAEYCWVAKAVGTGAGAAIGSAKSKLNLK